MTLFICLILVLMLVATVVAIYVEWLAHREVMAARRAPPAGVLHLARQVEALQADVDALKGGQS